jgi:GT2 family glycosyltransferase
MAAADPPREPAPVLAGIAVHWRDEEGLAGLYRAWPAGDPRFELVVVDNGDDGRLPPPPPGDGVRLLRPGRNLGFAGGANAGAAAARAPLLLFLNPDAWPEPGALDALVAGFAAHPEAAGLAPRLVGPGGAPQTAWQLRPLPGAGRLLAQTVFLPAGGGPRREPPAGARVGQPAAAALALRRDAFAAVGGFDAAFHPAWFEDVDLAARLAAAGGTLLYWPAAAFRHRLGATVPALGYGRFLWCYYRNLVRYLGKHHGRAAALAARALLPPAALLRLVLLPCRRPRRAGGRREAAAGLAALAAGALTGWRRPARWAAEGAARPGADPAPDRVADPFGGPAAGARDESGAGRRGAVP